VGVCNGECVKGSVCHRQCASPSVFLCASEGMHQSIMSCMHAQSIMSFMHALCQEHVYDMKIETLA
jgi:hypothetical protein